MLTPDTRRILLEIARAAIVARLSGQQLHLTMDAGVLGEPARAFVTIRKAHTLRGCIGHIELDTPLAALIARCAASAATEDPRFSPVATDEVNDIEIEISVLTPPERIERVEDIEIGRHGLIASAGHRRGLLLPQVATEWGWDNRMFASQTCVKAGLRPDAWTTDARLWRFEAEIFSEVDVA